MPTTEFLKQFQAYLDKLKSEIEAYPDDASLWLLADGISNPGGTLCRHLTGNLNHFIGHALGNTGYVRDRPLEFSIRDLPKAQLVKDIAEARAMLAQVLPSVNLDAGYPPEMWGKEMSVRSSLLKLVTHLAYHVGQVNYHRRLVGG